MCGVLWLDRPMQFLKARDTLHRICDLAEDFSVVCTLDNLNLFDHPGFPFGAAEDVLALVSFVNRLQSWINLLLYRTQIGEGDVLRWCKPGTGEMSYAAITSGLKAIGYAGTVR